MTTLAFRLARPLPLWNTVMRTHHWQRAKTLRTLAGEVGWAIVEVPGQYRPSEPFTTAKITITRRSTGDPDPDGLSLKYLLDVLQPASSRHPYGLGIIKEDTAKHLGAMGAVIRHEHVAHRVEQCTLVVIEGE
jgi:hypothetical protein